MSRLLLFPLLCAVTLLNAKNLEFNNPLYTDADSLPPAINCPGNLSFTLTASDCDTVVNYTVVAYDNEPGFVLSQLEGLASGANFPIGATLHSFLVTDVAGNTAACSFTITVLNFPHLLLCQDEAPIVALDTACTAMPGWDVFLENLQTGCPEEYLVQIDRTAPFGNGPWTPALFTLADKDKTFTYRVRDLSSDGNCTGTLQIRDLQGPALLCSDINIPCEVSPVAPEFLYDSLGIANAYPQISDNCGVVSDTIFLSSLDFVDEYDPLTQVLKFTRRVWLATDDSGNSSSCEQYIYQVKSKLSDVFFPADLTFECSDTLVITPAVAGQPYIVFAERIFPLNACAMVYTYMDSIVVECGQSRRVFRTWYLLDSETAEERSGVQIIDIQDVLPPQVACPAQLTITVEASSCLSVVSLPDAVISDGCTHISSFAAHWMQGDTVRTVAGVLEGFAGNDPLVNDTLGALDAVSQFPVGARQITYVATDACGNTGSCVWTLTVLDADIPLAVCDTLKTVLLGPDGQVTIAAEALDSGSEDACLPVSFKVRLNAPNACQAALVWDDSLLLCCSNLGDTLAATLRVYDVETPAGAVDNTFGAGHFAECTARVIVTDTLPPLCDNLPDITVSCGVFDPTLAAYGDFPFSCAVDSTFIELDYSIFDTLCQIGTITRTFNIVNMFGQTAYCLQRITVDPEQQHYYVRFPDDVNVTACAAGQIYGMPTIFQLPGGCERIHISYTDEIVTIVPDACYRIDRTWTILNDCNYTSGLPQVMVPNPQVMTGPVVSAPGTTGLWAPTPLFENFWSANSNGYQYTQRIKIIDQTPPVLESCPQTTLFVQDSSNNSTQLWNESYWLDPQHQTSDLCEGAVDLSISASDACSGSDLTFRYRLFLDLDGDDLQETVVNSNNFPGYNTVYYDNVSTPNFSGGTARQFDERPVSALQKWGFAMEVVRVDTHATAYVRFNSQLSPQLYVVPQLPHGKHRIQWVVTDYCGRESVCQYEFTIRDGKPPEISCPDSITVSFENDDPGIARLQTEDVLWSKADNCSPSGMISTALRLSGTGTGFPENPVQQMEFTCLADADSNKIVEVWARDVAGNVRFCEVNVRVDPCGLEVPDPANHIAGSVKIETGLAIKDVAIQAFLAKDASTLTLSDTTDTSGSYDIFIDPAEIGSTYLGGTAAIFPYKNTLPLEGVTTFDLLLISRHIIGLDTLESPYRIIAADANKSGLVTSLDIVELRKLILGISEVLPNTTTWRFIPVDYVFPDLLNPFQPAFPESDSSLYFLNGGAFDFIGLKVGDVNVSVDPQMLDADLPERREQVLPVQTSQRNVVEGEEFTATFSTLQPSEGFQFTMHYRDMELLEILPGRGMTAEQFAHFPEKNALTTACENTVPSSFSLRFRVLRSGALCDLLRIGSEITPAAAWLPVSGKQVIPAEVALRFADTDGFTLLQNQPNPFVDKTLIRFQLPQASEATIQVFDGMGRVVFAQSGWFAQGMHAVQVDLATAQPGIFYYQVETAEHRAVQKMIRSEL